MTQGFCLVVKQNLMEKVPDIKDFCEEKKLNRKGLTPQPPQEGAEKSVIK